GSGVGRRGLSVRARELTPEMASAGEEPGTDIGRLIDERPWGRYQTWVVILVALAAVMDGLDNRLLPLAIPSLIKEWDVTRDAFALATSVGLAGMVIGTMVG